MRMHEPREKKRFSFKEEKGNRIRQKLLEKAGRSTPHQTTHIIRGAELDLAPLPSPQSLVISSDSTGVTPHQSPSKTQNSAFEQSCPHARAPPTLKVGRAS